ncbi:DNA repair metallo-beta-lactamase-domain-containing protein [Dactylonectria macrodidyma]|uniref:DNA repair metallo-beta-lactamase-domain-containing protein n=1 Tax=Dactylonectria macrodidyma TaxID=307937 RepID=A0A9P9FQY9_9HYPO|nr:DNA repair metallo-beta-lactamase-domain-containing protein [Dactylonectria macrodidyma]
MVTSTKSGRSHTPRKAVSSPHVSRKPAKPNASILSFFKKADKPEDSLFVGGTTAPKPSILSFFKKAEKQEDPLFVGTASETPDSGLEDIYSAIDSDRYNEVQSSNKKRKLSQEPEDGLTKEVEAELEKTSSPAKAEENSRSKKPRMQTGFVIDSDSEDEADDSVNVDKPAIKTTSQCAEYSPIKEVHIDDFAKDNKKDAEEDDINPTNLKHEDSTYEQFNDSGEFPDIPGLDTDDFEGEEMRERRFMREQALLEAEEAGWLSSEDLADDTFNDGSMIESCPICNGSLAGVSTDEATRHVNSCLDGNPIPLPQVEKSAPSGPKEPSEVEAGEVSKRFARAAVPRPGQANPFDIDAPKNTPKSAFSKIMSNNAEDSAWATAAAAEHSSRGRPAYERTCPFYKIMPGFFICVDAFRYGAVEGCKAYFLSHFHSDHYIGLTSTWRHGPIYCSKVTGSLVKQQLRTAAKWVVGLEFDKPYDIPGTEGATVTMIPANHCPGSSLFLFEKTMRKGPNSRMQRILHCGDFRACPAHVTHPLLKPDIVDSISGKQKQQKIDICYLDTTYLNPRYSFPRQDDVITACADLIGSMSPNPNCKDDVWDHAAKSTGTPTVSKFFKGKWTGENEQSATKAGPRQRLLVICGTYSIGKERICIAIAKALGSKIFASPGKIKICKQLGDPELTELLTSNPVEAQVHMQMLMEIRAETLQEYLNSYKPHFSRIVGFRPSGWNFRPANGKPIGANTSPSSIQTDQILHGKGWRTRFGYKDFTPQRGSTKEAMCFGVPYSEHSSFRELALFVMSLRIEKVIPTVNVGSEQSRTRMKGWIDRWMAERRRGGLVIPLIEDEDDESKALWEGKSGKGGGAWW